MRMALAVVAGLLLCAAGAGQALAQPGFPASFYGAATINGEPVPDGTEVRAYIGGVDCTQLGANYRTTVTVEGVSLYAVEVVHESQMEGCGREGTTVTFTIDGQVATQTAEWRPGAQELNINAGSGSPSTPPPPTPTPTVEPTAAAETATVAAGFTPIDEPPPTDVVTIPGSGRTATGEDTTTPEAPGAGSEDDDGDGSGGTFLVLAVVVAGLVVIGAVGGIVLSRVTRPGGEQSG